MFCRLRKLSDEAVAVRNRIYCASDSTSIDVLEQPWRKEGKEPINGNVEKAEEANENKPSKSSTPAWSDIDGRSELKKYKKSNEGRNEKEIECEGIDKNENENDP